MLIVSEDDINEVLNIVNIVPLTTRKQGRTIYPNEVLLPAGKFGLNSESVLLCHQIRTIDKRRLSKSYGRISDKNIRLQVMQALSFQLGIYLK